MSAAVRKADDCQDSCPRSKMETLVCGPHDGELQFEGEIPCEEWHVSDRDERSNMALMLTHWAFLMMLFAMISSTIRIQDLSETVAGVRHFLEDEVSFRLPDGTHGELARVVTSDDAVNYAQSLVETLLSERSYKGSRPLEERLMFLNVHRLVTSIVVSQERVDSTDCSPRALRPGSRRVAAAIQRHCEEGVEYHAVTGGAYLLQNGVKVPYAAQFGGYAVELPLDRDGAIDGLRELRDGHFVDRATRRLTVLFALANSPGHYMGNVKLDFLITPSGVESRVEQHYLRLRPYSAEVQGSLFLSLQLASLVLWLSLFAARCVTIRSQPHARLRVAKLLHPMSLLEMLCHILLLSSAILWVSYLRDPGRVRVDLHARSFQDISALSATFAHVVFLQVAALLLWSLRLTGFAAAGRLNADRAARFLDALLQSAGRVALAAAMVVSSFAFVALAFESKDRSDGELDSLGSLILCAFTLSGGQRELVRLPGGVIFGALFALVSVAVLFHMLIAVAGAAQTAPALHPDKLGIRKPPNHTLADALCDALGLAKCEEDLCARCASAPLAEDQADDASFSEASIPNPADMQGPYSWP